MLPSKPAEGTLLTYTVVHFKRNVGLWISGCMELPSDSCLSLQTHSSHVKDNQALWVKVKGRMFCQKQMRMRDERDLRGGGDKTSDLDTSLLLLKNSKKGSEWMWYSLWICISISFAYKNQYYSKITRVSLQSSKSNLFSFILQHLQETERGSRDEQHSMRYRSAS